MRALSGARCTDARLYTLRIKIGRAGEGISEPLSDILYNMLSDELFKHPATQIESLVLSCR